MTVFEDLTSFTYGPVPDGVSVLNVGWLGRGSRFEVGESEPGLGDALIALAAFRSVNTMRGYHLCGLGRCRPEDDEWTIVPYPLARRGEVALGSAEIWVPGDGVVYAAPTLVVHYVNQHRYRPPEAFRHGALALARADAQTWVEAKRALPVGTTVRGVVAGRYLSGLGLTLPDLPELSMRVPTDSYRPDGSVLDPSEFPEIGAPVEAVVTEHVDQGREILLRVDPN